MDAPATGHRVRRRVSRGLRVILLAVFSVLASAAVQLNLPSTRKLAAEWATRTLSGEVKGALVIAHFDSIAPTHIVARGLTLWDGQGNAIINADRLTLELDWGKLLSGRIAFRHAQLDGARVRLVPTEDGLPTLLATFDAPEPAASGSTKSDSADIVVSGIAIEHVTLYGDLLGLRGFVAHDLRAAGELAIGRFVRARVDSASAALSEPFGYVAQIDSLHGLISTEPKEGIRLDADTRRDNERAIARIVYAAPDGRPEAAPELDLHVTARELSDGTLHGLGYGFVPDLGTRLAGNFHLHGPIDALGLDADLATSAGPVSVSGSLSDAHGIDVKLSTPGVELAQLLPGYPEVHAQGRVQITRAVNEERPRLHLEVGPMTWGVLQVPPFTIEGLLTERGLRIDRVDGRGRGSRVAGRGVVRDDGRVALDLRASFAEIRTDPNFVHWTRGAEGRLDATVHIEREVAGPATLNFSGSVVLDNFQLGLLRARRLKLSGTARGDPQRPRLAVSVGGKEVHLGEYMLGDPKLTVMGGPHDYQAVGQFLDQGRRTFHIAARLHAKPDAVLIDADPIEFSVGNGTWRGAMNGLRITQSSEIQLEQLRLASRSQRLEAHGQLGGRSGKQLQAELQNFDVAALRALIGEQLVLEQGYADMRLVIGGSAADPEFLVQGALRDGSTGQLKQISAAYLAKYKAGQVEANGELDLGKHGLLRVDGRAQLPRTRSSITEGLKHGSYAFELSAEQLDISIARALSRARLKGTLGATLSVHGTLERPDVHGTVDMSRFSIGDAPAVEVSAAGEFTEKRLRAKAAIGDEVGPLGAFDADVHLDLATLTARPDQAFGTLIQGPWHVQGRTAARRLDAMPGPIAERFPYPAAIATNFHFGREGSASTQGEIEFDVDWHEAFDDTSCAQDVRASAHGSLKLADATSHLTMTVRNGQTHIGELDAVVDTPVERWAERGAVTMPQLLRAHASATVETMAKIPYFCEYGDGHLTGELELDGGFTTRPLLAARLESEFLPQTDLDRSPHARSSRSCGNDPVRIKAELNADREQLTGTAHMQGCQGGATEARGRMAVRWDKWLVLPTPDHAGRVDAHVSLDGAELKPLLEHIPSVRYARARARGEVALTGTVDDLAWSGQVGVDSGRLYVVSTGQEVRDLEAWLAFHGNWAKLEQARARVGNGQIDISGGVGFTGILPSRARIAIHAKDLPIKQEGIEVAALSGTSSLDATIESHKTRAKVRIDELRVRLPEESNRTLQSLDPHQEVTVVTEAKRPVHEAYPLELEISGGNVVHVQRNDFQASIEPKLSVRFADPSLNVDGLITFYAGEFEVFGKRFQVNTGSLRFDGGPELNPELYLMATQKTDSANRAAVNVWVTGTMQKPEVTFNVDVCSGEAAAINYLLSGQCGSNADDSLTQDTGNAPAAFAAGVIGGFLTLGAQRELKGFAPRIAIERTENAQRVHAGFSSESLIPPSLRGIVQRVYIAGGVLSPNASSTNAEGTSTGPATTAVELLVDLYFPHNLVGSARAAPPAWAFDMLWEP